MATKVIFENAEGAETRTKKLNALKKTVDTLDTRDTLDFKTTEQTTGVKWKDGRIIYQKTINFGGVATGTQSVAHGITGLDFVLEANGYATQANGIKSIIPRLAGTPLTNSIFYDKVDATLIYGYVGTSFVSPANITGGAITIKYVKA